MFLRYLESAPQAETLLLRNAGGWRVELCILRNNDESYSLVAMSGGEGSQAERSKIQGPYQVRDQALAARSAVTAELLEAGFEVDEEAIPQWRLLAQRRIRELRAMRSESTPDCRFDPKDVL